MTLYMCKYLLGEELVVQSKMWARVPKDLFLRLVIQPLQIFLYVSAIKIQ